MKKPMLFMVALAALPGQLLLAQSLTGSWQGSLKVAADKELRIVFKVATTDGDALKATMYSIDQAGAGIASHVTRQGSNVTMAVPGIGGSFEGKLSADGNMIAGTWSQGPGKIPLNLARATNETAWAIPEPPPPVVPMKADAKPGFEVATIKPSKPDQQGRLFTIRGKQVLAINVSVNDLITFAYDLHPRQLTGGPSGMDTDKFDVTGEPDQPGRPNLKQMKLMMQQLLADRFKLTFHREKRELSVYAIVVAKGGPKLTKSEATGDTPGLLFQGLGKLPARNTTIAEFAAVMQDAVMDRPVVDQTGITGRWDFALNWTPDPSQFVGLGVKVPPPPDDPSAPPDLFTALQQQAGLKMESTKAPVDILVVDKVEKPSEN